MIAQTDFAAFLKERYPSPDDIMNLARKNQPFFEMIQRDETQGGQDLRVPLIISTNVRRSCTFSVAQNGSDNASTSYQAFKMTLAQDFCLASWTSKLLKVSEGDANSLEQVIDAEMKRSVQALERSYGIKIWRTGTGSVCNVLLNTAVNNSSGALSIFPKGSAQHFEVGDAVQASSSDGGALRATGAVMYVIEVDRTNDIIYLSTTFGGSGSAPSSTLTSLSASSNTTCGDFIYKNGDAANNTGTNLATEGVQSFIPFSTSGLGTAFYNVTRSVDAVRLAGDRIDNTALNLPLDEILVYAVTQAEVNGSMPDAIFLNPFQTRDLINRMSSKIIRTDQKQGKVGFGALALLTDSGREVPIYSDINCDYRYGLVTQMDTWKLISAGPPIHVDNFDGNEFLRTSTASGYELRLQGYPQLTNNAPGWSVIIAL
jgi:hypothetical protein